MKRNENASILNAQQRLWRIAQSRPGDPALHLVAGFALSGELNVAALEQALNALVEQHDELRSNFEIRDGRLLRVISDRLRIDLPVVDVRDDAAEAERMAREPFCLESGPLMRARLLRLGVSRHTLLLTFHQMVSEARSLNPLMEQLADNYEAFAAGVAPRPATTEVSTPQDSLTLVDDECPRFELMPDFPRTVLPNPRAKFLFHEMPLALMDAFVQNLNGEAGFVAALVTLLARSTGETDIAIGIERDNRNSILRVDTSGDPSFVELKGRVTDGQLLHADEPPSINFVQSAEPLRGWTRASVQAEPLPATSPGALYDLNFRLAGRTLSCEYNTELCRPETIEAVLEHFELLCADIVGQPERKLSEFLFLSPSEQQKLLVDWNATAAEYPRELCIHQLFEQCAARTPDGIAVEFGNRTLTYGELEVNANRLARELVQRGAGPGSLVGIFLDRSPDMVIAVLAVLKAGGAYLPLDPSFPASRLEFMAADAGIRILVTSAVLAGSLKTNARAVLVGSVQAARSLPLNYIIDSESLAYVLYTSGSTGQPKGVEVRHRSVVNLLCAMQSHVEMDAQGSLLAVTTLSFDISVLELFLPLTIGARLVLASKEQASDPRALRDLFAASKPTLMQATPGTWRMLADAGWTGSRDLKVLVGGEKVPREVADLLLDRAQAVWNCYGPTETTVWSTICRLEKDGRPISIGRPLANTTLYVLDANRRLLPIGSPGELYIGGDGVARGYLNRPELTAERFIANPFGQGNLYRTGDIVRYGPDGGLEILGRNDGQVKIRGFRIELGDVEAALSACPQVRAAAVVERKALSGESILAGYFAAPETATVAAVRAQLASRMPAYMVPAFLVRMDELPRTPNGKIDRKALPAPQEAVSTPLTQSDDSLETTLIGIWESILGVRPIRATDNFFDLGGESVTAARIFVRMEQRLGKALPLATLFRAPTIGELADVIRKSEWKPMFSSLVPIRPEGTKPPFFFVHPIGGNVLNFSGFCSHFGPDQPIYGLQARGLDSEVTPHTSVEEMAADYIEDIRSVQPDGPYHIGGFSAGGVVAFEMARQLQSVAQPVSILALLDTEILTLATGEVSFEARLNHWWRKVKVNLRYVSRMSLFEYIKKKSFNLRMRRKLFAWDLKERLGLAIDPAALNVEEAFLLAFKRYVPQTYYGDATLFRAGDGAEYLDARLGWGDIVRGRLDIQEVTGDHDTILQEPHIGMLARLLENCLAEVNGGQIERLAMAASAGAGQSVSGLTPAIDLGKS